MPRPKVKNPGRILKRIMGIVMRSYGFQIALVLLCIVITVFANVQGTLFAKTLIDTYIAPLKKVADAGMAVDLAPLAKAIGRVAMFYLIGIAGTLTQSLCMSFVTQGTLRRIREQLFEHMEKLPLKYFDTHSHGDVMSIYTNDTDALRQMISQSLPNIISSFITIASVLVSMVILSVPLTLVSIAMVAVMIFASMFATRRSGRNFVAQQENLGRLNGFIEETMTGEKVVQVFNHGEESIKAFDEMNQQLYESAYKANAYSNIIGPVNAQISNVSYVLCAIIGGIIALDPAAGFTVGALASFLSFNKNFGMPINQVSMQMNSIFMALAGADRIFRLLDEKPETDEGYVMLVDARTDSDGSVTETDEHTGEWAWKHYHKATGTTTYIPLEGDITFSDVDFGYSDDKMVLHDINLHAKPGQKVALVGSTGAGKTTITNLINRFYGIQEGKIRYDNININKIQKNDLRRSLGIVLQETALFTGTIADNIRYGKLDATEDEVVAAARLAHADEFIRQLPQGYDTVIRANGGDLSQGQCQLLSIARAIIADPPVLILDEATSSIDTRTEKLIQEGMDELMKGRTSFVIAHRLSTIRNSDVILVMEHGRIIESGSHEELLEQKGRYYQLYTGKSA
ncbi:MAG: ABC transporter ATP-binding protein [Sphaerochaetaceae bacterium]